MADFLFQLAPVQQRRPRSYGFNANLLNYSDEEHRARYRFGRESIENITNLIEADLRRKTYRGHRFSFVSFPKSENSFFAVEVKVFHLSLTSWTVR